MLEISARELIQKWLDMCLENLRCEGCKLYEVCGQPLYTGNFKKVVEILQKETASAKTESK